MISLLSDPRIDTSLALESLSLLLVAQQGKKKNH
jgi:hypothetical protein